MAVNLLTIEKEPNDYFTFTLNGDTANAIKNTRNDLTTVGDFCHFKTSNGANLISEQNVTYGNVTIIDGVTTLIPSSVDDLFDKLISVNYFDWFSGGGSGGVNRFDELLDTFTYDNQALKFVRVNVSETQLEPVTLTIATKSTDLSDMPASLTAGKMLRVNPAGTAYELIDSPIASGGYNQLFVYASGAQEFTLATGATISLVFLNNTPLKKDIDYSVSGNLLTILGTVTLIANDEIVAIGNI